MLHLGKFEINYHACTLEWRVAGGGEGLGEREEGEELEEYSYSYSSS